MGTPPPITHRPPAGHAGPALQKFPVGRHPCAPPQATPMGGAEPRPYSPQESTPHSLQCVIAKPVRTLAVAIRLLRPLRRGITDSHVASLLGMTREVFVRHSKTAASGGSGGFALLGEGEECMEKKKYERLLIAGSQGHDAYDHQHTGQSGQNNIQEHTSDLLISICFS